MFGSIIILSSLFIAARSAFEELKKDVFTIEKTGRWKGKSDAHIPMMDLEPTKGGGWHGWMWTTHVKQADHYIGKHWVEDGAGTVIQDNDFSFADENPLNMDKNQTTHFKVPKGAKEPLTTYAWCNVHGTWAHTWSHVQLWQADEDEEGDEHGKDDESEPKGGMTYKKRFEVPHHPKVTAEDMKEFKTTVFTVEAPGQWRGKAGAHVPMLDLHPVEGGGGWIAELETTHGKDAKDFISKHWVEDGAGNVLGVVHFDINDDSDTNQPKKQASKFHVPRGAREPLTTYSYCNLHGTWAHTWSTLSLDQHHTDDEL